MQTFRVSHLAAFARWREDDDSEVGWLINDIRSNEETEPMRRGTAFHKALETIKDGWEGAEIVSGNYRFVFTVDVELSLPETRETRRSKNYGGIIVSGQADGIGGKIIIDHKTTSHFDAENYLEDWQHKFYLDIFEADQFTWYAWEMKEIKGSDPDEDDLNRMDSEERSALSTAAILAPKVYEVFGFHRLTQYRYPGLERDCAELAADFKRFADRYLPDYSFTPTECAHAPERPAPKPTESPVSREFGMVAARGTNVIGVGWKDGTLRVCFAGKKGPRFWRFMNVPADEFLKLGRSPYPDRLFSTNIKGKFKGEAEAA